MPYSINFKQAHKEIWISGMTKFEANTQLISIAKTKADIENSARHH